ncbi:hypothetical protein E6W39_18990 [Kitasatospora acidiphila]|uniref:Uncharacterized protein n=1 Tax=Kitasatospora acidiphila TaxID=2567942 RepID=A0A540W4H8_9ACTN|nr:hypothetical protein [Kitasatospora acidiphila]TQF03938.1 hypothetical protein E6W39_18990 [Kitasatospora acidiphila]
MTTPVPPTSWTPLTSYDNFNPPIPTNLDPNWTYPDYVLNGIEPAVTGVPADNPNYPTFRIGRIIGQGSDTGTWMIRTWDGWLLDNVLPHASYEAGDFVLLLACGTWVVDLGQRTYLPAVPLIPAYVPTS